jgi:exonuclease III
MDISILNWNTRGLNNPARRKSIQRFIANHNSNIVVFQEMKVANVHAGLISEAIGARFASNFIFQPADGTRGGILIACSDDFSIDINPAASSNNFITGTITDKSNGTSWSLTAVYCPQDDPDKIQFMQDLRGLKQIVLPQWMLLGDFNLIKSVEEKSNQNINIRMMGRRTIEDLELREIPLVGRRFTWSNERENIVMTKIDRVLISPEWEVAHLDYLLVPSSISDHCPLIVKKLQTNHYAGFRFEACWLKHNGFLQIVQQA